jgi:hypothetical protein
MEIQELKNRKSTAYVIEKFRCGVIAANRWAQRNGVMKIGNRYFWSDEDIARFAKRPKPGYPGGPRKKT